MANAASIRLGTTNKAQVKADFAEVAESGTASFVRVGDAAEAQAKRWTRAEEAALRDIEAGRVRLERARAKSALLAPGLNPAKLDAFASVNDNVGTSAAASAQVFEAAYRKMEQRANALVAAIDPVFAAQQRFDREIANARTLLDAGALSAERYAQVERQLVTELNSVTVAHARGANSAGALRSAMQGASYQVQDTFTQLSMGANVMQVVAIQGGQLAGQFANIEGKAGAVARFMIGPWGLAITGALLVLGPLTKGMFDFGNALDDAVDKLKKDAKESDVTARAKDIFARSLEGVRAAARDQARALDEAADSEKSAAQRAYDLAQANLKVELTTRQATAALLEKAIAQQRASQANVQYDADQGAGVARGRDTALVNDLTRQLVESKKQIDLMKRNLLGAGVALTVENARREADPIEKINDAYKRRANAAIAAADAAAKRGKDTRSWLDAELQGIERNRAAAEKTERERQNAASSTKRDAETLTAMSVARMLRQSLPGVHVTSTTGGKHVANSYHYRNQAVDFVPEGGMQSMTKADVRKLFESRGIDIVELLGPGDKGHSDHFHVAWTKGKLALDEFSDAAKRAGERQRELEGLTSKFDPATAAAENYRQTLAKIAMLSPPNADALKAGAWADYAKTRAAAFDLPVIEDYRPASVAADKADADRDEAAKRRAEFVRQTLDGQRESTALTQRELQLVGTNDNYRDAELAKLRLIFDLKKAGVSVDSAEGIQILANADAYDRLAEQLNRSQDAAKVAAMGLDELRGYGAEFVDTVLSEDTWSSWGNAGRTVLNSLKSEFIKLALLNPLKNLINGDKGLPTLTSALGNIGKLFGGKIAVGSPTVGTSGLLSGYATGTEYASGGMSLVGENGPEILNIPRGSRVTQAADTRRMLTGGGHAAPTLHFDLRGAVVTQDLLDQMNAMAQAAQQGGAMQGAAGGAAISAAEARASGARRLGRRW